MKIMLAGSFSLAKEIIDIKNQLKELGHTVLAAKDLEICAEFPQTKSSFEEELKHCIKYDSMRDGFNQIVNSDAILVCNFPKKGENGYLGIAVLMELAVAYHLNKKTYCLFNYDKSKNYGLEVTVINPIVIDNDLTKIE